MKKNKRILLLISIVLAVAYIARVAYVNTNVLAANTLTYKFGDEVPIENNYFNGNNEKMNGYTITVLGTEFIPIEEFQAEHEKFVNSLQAENILLIRVRVKNVDNTEGGINFGHYLIQKGSYINFLNRDAYPYVNEFDTFTFALMTDSEMEFVLPFNIDSRYVDIMKLQENKPTLVVSLYPNKKVIELSN